MNNFVKNFNELIEIYKYTNRRLAKVLGVSCGTISNYRNGVYEPNIEMLIRISNLFDISLDDLIL